MPLNVSEFPAAAVHYPIVFTDGDKATAICVLGLHIVENACLDGQGRWAEGYYVAAYVRRYPFVLARKDNSTDLMLCVDTQSDRIGPDAAEPPYRDGETTDIVKNALERCVTYEREAAASGAVNKKIVEHDLPVQNQGQFTLSSGETLKVTDFRVVDEKRFNALSDEAFIDLREAGALSAIYCHLLSMRNWEAVARRVEAAGKARDLPDVQPAVS